MDAGRLNRRVRLSRLDTSAVDSFGQTKPAWVEVATVWADVAMKSGVSTILADADSATVKASIRIRFRLDVEHGWRAEVVRNIDGVVTVDRTFTVDVSLPDFKGREYTDLAVTGVANS